MMITLRILIVDDNSLFRAAAAALLASDRRLAVVGQAESGAAALALVAQLRPELVLVDLVMPGMDGLSAIHQIKACSDAPQVIAVTLHEHPGYHSAALAAGADGFVVKDSFATSILPLITRLFPRLGSPTSVGSAHAHSATPDDHYGDMRPPQR